MTQTTRTLSGLNILLGIWLIATPFLFQMPTGAFWSTLVTGVIITALAAYNYTQTAQGREVSTGAAVANAILGLWIVASMFVYNIAAQVTLWNGVIAGLLVLVFAAYNAYASGQRGAPMR
ncbi:MAG: SPW repeat protein [Euryarchaeota archaeon]|nr:SPW repeat protein [Euryarchaeota archaeon]